MSNIPAELESSSNSPVGNMTAAKRPICVGFHMIGGRQWFGGRNYLLNLLQTIDEWAQDRVKCNLFVDTNTRCEDLEDFSQLQACDVVKSSAFTAPKFTSQSILRHASSIFSSFAVGRQEQVEREFLSRGVDVAFENARYYGRRFAVPTISWLPDFQHRRLRNQFSLSQYWRREIGFRFQTNGSRLIMVSSDDASKDCVRYYRRSEGLVHAVPFAVKYAGPSVCREGAAIREKYGLANDFIFLPNQFYTHKNHMLVARALKILRDHGNPITVVATGNPKDVRGADVYADLVRHVRNNSIEQSFRLIGIVPYFEVRTLLNISSGLLNPSLCEGWSTTVEEAKSDGVPMILSDLDVHKEQAPEALFFDRTSPEDLAEKLLHHASTPHVKRRPEELQRDADRRRQAFADQFVRLVRLAHARKGCVSSP